MFCYYLLRGDTVVPSGLYVRLCHAFPVINVSLPGVRLLSVDG